MGFGETEITNGSITFYSILEIFLSVSYKMNHLSYGSAITLVGIY